MTRFVTVSLFVVMLAACNVPPTVTPARSCIAHADYNTYTDRCDTADFV